MRGWMIFLACLMAVTAAMAAPMRVALLDFDNTATLSDSSSALAGVTPQALAAKGATALGTALANRPDFVLVDRRDFVRRMQPVSPSADGQKYQPSFLQAAQAVNADLVLRGTLLSYAPGKQIVNLGENRTEFTTLTLRVALEVLDAHDGSVIASENGVARREFRQTDSLQTVLGEDELVELLQTAIDKAIPGLQSALAKRRQQLLERPRVKLSVRTSADPALIEIDGMLIGTTPLTDFAVYSGDHVLTVGKAGYQDVNKRILVQNDMTIEVPMLRTQMSADEIKEVLEKSRLNVVSGVPEAALQIHQVDITTQNEP
ncbi:MAG: PEGA domain-containing protein [Kiritimatiellia bacterium]